MKIYKIDFDPMYPVPCGCIIAANGIDECDKIARNTITHVKEFKIIEVNIDKPCVIFYESGDY
jgi:hypothetical protein